MIYYEYKNKSGSIIASNIDNFPKLRNFIGDEEKNLVIGKFRNGYKENDLGSVRIISDDPDHINSKRLFESLLESRLETIEHIIEFEQRTTEKSNDMLRLFAHNLTTIFTHLKGKVQRIYNEEVYKNGDYGEQQTLVREKLSRNPDRAADDYCQIAKRIDDLGAQIDGFALLSGRESKLDMGRYDFMRIALRCAQPFFQDFYSKDISLEFEGRENFQKLKTLLDPKLINLALHHFFHNSTKYCASNSKIKIFIESKNDHISVNFDMFSVRIEEEERERIFHKGFSGRHAESQKGEGLGLFVAKTALVKFGADLLVPVCASENIRDIGGTPFCDNRFTFIFPDKTL